MKTRPTKINYLMAFCLEPGDIFWFRGTKGWVKEKDGLWLTVRYSMEMEESKLYGYEKVRV